MTRLFQFSLVSALCLFLMGCGGNVPITAPNPTPTNLARETLPYTSIPTELPQTRTPTPAQSGPWLVIITPDGAWVINANGSGLSRVVDKPILAPQNTFAMPAPTGGFAAFITGDSRLRDLTLHILSLPRNLTRTIPMTAPDYAIQADSEPGNPEVEAARAVVEQASLSWSPNGSQLAFMGMREGPTSDLYTFSMDAVWAVTPEDGSKGFTRWTDSPSQEITPTWSPDGHYILHAAVNSLGTGAGQDIAGVWAVDTQTGEVHNVYITENSEAETFIGWQDEDTFLVHSWTPVCGNERLRMVDVKSGEMRIIWEGAFNGVAFAREIENGRLLVSLDIYIASCKGNVGPGLFQLFGPDYAAPSVLLSEEVFLPVWDGWSQMFFARTADHVYAFQYESEEMFPVHQLQSPAPVLPSASPRGEALAWTLPSGVWVGTLNTSPVQIFTSPASLPVWSPDGLTLFFVAEAGLYLAHAPDFVPQLIGEGLFGTGAFWVPP